MVGGEGQGVVFPAERAILSLALGRQNVVHVAIVDRAAAARAQHAIDRWRAFIGLNDGLSASTTAPPGASAMDAKGGVDWAIRQTSRGSERPPPWAPSARRNTARKSE